MVAKLTNPSDSGPTKELSHWVSSLTFSDIPKKIRTRAKYLILDGLTCAFIGAHLPWSEKAVNAILDLEGTGGSAVLVGWGGTRASPLSSALLNSTFIQGFELDDWHSEAPLHSNSILLPALFAAAQHVKSKDPSASVSGPDLLLATVVGYEVGPRVGLALYGSHVLPTGWHSGAVFGPAASVASAGKLLGLDQEQIEFESDVKRMQHGFAARNGLMAAFLARGGYTGIDRVFEREYGGFLKQFSSGNGKDPAYLAAELTKGLGSKWQTDHVRIKPYASMAGTHPTIDCVRKLQALHPDRMHSNNSRAIKSITIILGEAAFHHGGWKATRPLTSTGAQMNNSFAAATQIIHGQVFPRQFRHDMLENDDVWRLVDITDCELTSEAVDVPIGRQRVSIEFEDGTVLTHSVDNALGVEPPLSNSQIVDKWRLHTSGIIDAGVRDKIEAIVLSMEQQEDLSPLFDLMSTSTTSPIA